MKNIRIVHGTLLYPLEVGSRALIFEAGRYLHTSKVIAIHGVTPRQIRFETMNSQELICKGWFLPSNTYDCGSFVVN